ncbi:MAG TPA: hypothetical protein ENN07_08330 [candidate division Zixibacteria bacterium]|nr:hypothetical protein [candidate division Zixibacteria bacterium]
MKNVMWLVVIVLLSAVLYAQTESQSSFLLSLSNMSSEDSLALKEWFTDMSRDHLRARFYVDTITTRPRLSWLVWGSLIQVGGTLIISNSNASDDDKSNQILVVNMIGVAINLLAILSKEETTVIVPKHPASFYPQGYRAVDRW